MPTCPECDAMIDIDNGELEEGQTIECPECGSELEVVSTDPVELDSLNRGEDDEEDNEDGDVKIDNEEDT
jgi:alpha-aminoadipate/glutamate carrier protein LysW